MFLGNIIGPIFKKMNVVQYISRKILVKASFSQTIILKFPARRITEHILMTFKTVLFLIPFSCSHKGMKLHIDSNR